MIEMTASVVSDFRGIEKKVERGARNAFARTAHAIMETAQESIEPQQHLGDRSRPGEPPKTNVRRRGTKGRLPKSIIYAADPEGAVVGPTARLMGYAAGVHEHGGERRGVQYPARPTMAPALEQEITTFADEFDGML